MRGIYKALIALVVIVIVIFLVLGYVGVLGVPFVSPTIQSYSNATELEYSDVQELLEQSKNLPDLNLLESYGLNVHIYGTDDRANVIKSYYDLEMIGWEKEADDSGTGWTFDIWRNIAYGFGLGTLENAWLKHEVGYNTIFITVDGPASAWLPLLSNMD